MSPPRTSVRDLMRLVKARSQAWIPLLIHSASTASTEAIEAGH
jgi:hypothetical protein